MRVFLGAIYFMFFVNISYAASNIDSHGVILVYHHVSASTPPSTSISPEDFERHLEYLAVSYTHLTLPTSDLV